MTSAGKSICNIEKKTELKKEKSKSKSSFTLYRYRLLLLVSEQCLQENGLVYGIVDGGNVSVVRYLHTK